MTIFTSRHSRRHLTGAAVVAASLLAAPLGGSAQANFREVPNEACDEATPAAGFADRGSANLVHQRNIDCVAAHEIALGSEGRFHPHESVTRAQMASFVARTLEAAERTLPAPSDQGFTDIEGDEHADRINQLAEIGVVFGTGDGVYDPGAVVTREQMASYLVRTAGWAHDTTYSPAGPGSFFDDVVAGSTHRGNIVTGHELWLFDGRGDGVYAPGAPVTREEMATFLTRVFDFTHPSQWETQNQSYIVSPQQPALGLEVGEPFELSVGARYDARPFVGPVDIALVPCANANPTDLPVTFADADADSLADDFPGSDNNRASISTVNGEPTQGPVLEVRNAEPGEDGVLRFEVVAGLGPDCVIAVVHDDRLPLGEFRLDAGQRPAGPFGIAQVSWE